MLSLTENILKEIKNHCRKEYPKEACGILAGRKPVVGKVYHMKNVSETSGSYYFMDPEEQLKVFKEIRNSGLEMLAVYHSHPHSQAYPSESDREAAFYPEAAYVIVSLKDPAEPELRAFRIIRDNIEEEKIVQEGDNANGSKT